MYVEEKRDGEVIEDIFSLRSLIGWLEKQPPETTYDFSNRTTCVLAQYFRANGSPDAWCAASHVRLNGFDSPKSFFYGGQKGWNSPFHRISYEGEHTFGAALKRARRAERWQSQS